MYTFCFSSFYPNFFDFLFFFIFFCFTQPSFLLQCPPLPLLPSSSLLSSHRLVHLHSFLVALFSQWLASSITSAGKPPSLRYFHSRHSSYLHECSAYLTSTGAPLPLFSYHSLSSPWLVGSFRPLPYPLKTPGSISCFPTYLTLRNFLCFETFPSPGWFVSSRSRSFIDVVRGFRLHLWGERARSCEGREKALWPSAREASLPLPRIIFPREGVLWYNQTPSDSEPYCRTVFAPNRVQKCTQSSCPPFFISDAFHLFSRSLCTNLRDRASYI